MTSFSDLGDYVAIPRVTALRLSPDGSWLAATVQTVGGEPGKYVTSIWRLPAAREDGTVPASPAPARLTRSAEGEAAAEFLPDGSLLFISRRPGPPASGPDADADLGKDKPALWLLPAGGEAYRIAAPAGGVTGVAAARDRATIVFAAPALPGADGAEEDLRRRKARKDAGVTAILHESGPVRYWDHDLGPDSPRLLAAQLPEAAATADEPVLQTRDLTPEPGRALDEQAFDVSPDGSLVITGWSVWDHMGNRADEVHVIDAATGKRRMLLTAPDYDFEKPRVSPDGSLVACIRSEHDSYEAPGDVTLVVTGLDDTGDARDLLSGMDRRPLEAAWAADSGSVYFTADDQGRRPVFRADLATGEITRLTTDDGAYESLCPAPGGRFLYALRSAVSEPPTAVLLDVTGPGREPVRLACPGSPLELPGRLEEVDAVADDGARVRAWLVLPDAATPAGLPRCCSGCTVARS